MSDRIDKAVKINHPVLLKLLAGLGGFL